MQAAKDSFYRTLQTRLAAVNPARTILVDGVARPAILVAENIGFPPPRFSFETYYLHWLEARAVRGFAGTAAPRYELLAQLEYLLRGDAVLERPFADRGRRMAEMDRELLEILFPGCADKQDYTASPPLPLGSRLHWNWTPALRTESVAEHSLLRRIATVSVSFYLEEFSN